MPRRLRTDLAGFPLHVIQRGHNRSPCFLSVGDRTAYLFWLGRNAARLGVAIHAWVLMTNHVHVLLTPPSTAHASRLMQILGRRYVRYFNDTHMRSGTLWEGRYRAGAVHAEDYLLTCMRYIELNPVRAGIAEDPGAYPWSSYHRNALGRADQLVTEHVLYTGLGASILERQARYRDLFHGSEDAAALTDIRVATASGHLLAGKRTRNEIENARGLQLGPAQRGRPPKGDSEGTESRFKNRL